MQVRLKVKGRRWIAAAIFLPALVPSALLMAAADGSWMKKVSEADHARVNPYAGQATAAEAGRQVYLNNCAKCHGNNAEGKNGRPGLRNDHLAQATDGDLAWILKNGVPFKGMPSWSSLPEQQRWQAVTYIRNLQTAAPAVTGGAK